jgi:hypothetical protein
MSNEIVRKGFKAGKKAGVVLWQVARSDEAIAIIKVAATFAAFVAAIEELRRVNRRIGFRK